MTDPLAGLGLRVAHDIDELRRCTPPTVAVLSTQQPEVPGCYGWYVGPGTAPGWLHAVDGTAAQVLGLLGTSFAQERAGAAFRAASEGLPAPESVTFDSEGVLTGITRALAEPRYRRQGRPGRVDSAALLRSCFTVLDSCCADSGAIAAAPRSLDGPDYWFTWQRDSAHVAYALHLLALHGPDQKLREQAAARRDAWVRFVVDHSGAEGIAASRRTMGGQVVGGYGDPQQDGPAATALVLLTVVTPAQEALVAARPYLDYLLSAAAQEPGFDLWELIVGDSFHAANLRRRALSRAARLAASVGDPSARRYASAGTSLSRFHSKARPGLVNVLDPHPSWFGVVSRLDMGVVGSALLSYDPRDDDGDEHTAAIRDTFDELRRGGGYGMGRFPEDCNDGQGSSGGHPWTVTTLWAAQELLRRGTEADRRAALAYLADVLEGSPDALPEQLDAYTGRPRGAAPLAWAHAELVVTVLLLENRSH